MKKTKKTPKYSNGGSIYDDKDQKYSENAQAAGNYAQMAGNMAKSIDGGEDRYNGDFRSKNNQTQGTVMGAVGQIGPVGQVIQGGYNVGMAIGDPIRARSEATDEQGNLKNEGAAKRNAVVGSLFDPMKAFQTRASYEGGWTDLTGKKYAAHLESQAKQRIADEEAPQREAEKQDMLNKLQYGTFQFGGIAKQWGITPNAEVEKQENAIHPDGQFRQFNGPSHENGGIQTHLPEGTKVFSDKLKMPKTGKTFAELNKANDTRKEDKIINNPNATTVEKATASLMKLAKQKSSDMLFSTQEALKQAKVDSYTKRMGGIQKFPDGGKTTKSNTRVLSNDDIVNAVKYLHSNTDKNNTSYEENLRNMVSTADWDRINSLYNSPQGQALKPKEGFTFAMPDKTGRYVDSGISPTDAILPSITKGFSTISKGIDNIKKAEKSRTFKMLREAGRENLESGSTTDLRGIPYKNNKTTTQAMIDDMFDDVGSYITPSYETQLNSWKDYAIKSIDKGEKYLGFDDYIAKMSKHKYGGIQKYTDGGYAAWRKQKEAAGWVQSPLADPKSPYPDMYDPKALEIQKASNVGLNDHVWKAYDNTDYTYKALNPKALDAYGYKSPDFYGSYTPPAKTMSTPQFKAGAGYTPSPQNDGSYMMINDSNPNARYQYVGGKYQLIQKQAYGGVQKFKNGGESEEPSFGYTPDNLAGQYKLQQAYNNQKLYEESLAQYEDAMNKHNKYSSINPNNPYNPTFDFNMPVGGKLDQAILRDKNYSYKEDGMPANAGIPSEPNVSKEDSPEGTQSNSNWQNYLTQAALFAGNNLGNFYDLARTSEVEQDKYGKLQPTLLDSTAAMRNIAQTFKNVNESLKDSAGGHAGNYMTNRIASGIRESLTSDETRRNYANENARIKNSAQQYNIEQQKAEDIANMQNRAKSRDIKGNAISNIGSNTVSQYKDSKMTKADMDKIELIKQMYPSIKNNPDIVAYYKKKYPSVKWDEIEKSNK